MQIPRVHRFLSILDFFLFKIGSMALSGRSKRRQKLVFKTDYRLMQAKSIAECSKRAFCNTFDLHKLSFVIKTFVLSSFEWPFYTDFTVYAAL